MDVEGGDGSRQRRFVALFDAHYGSVLAYARRRLPIEVVDDAVADAFLAAWINLERVAGDPLPWLYSLAKGAVWNQRRRLARAARLNERAFAREVPRPAGDHADLVGWEEPFDAAFAALNEGDREVLRLTAWEGLTPSSGAIVLGCSVGAFKVRLHRARRRLRALLDAESISSAAALNAFSERAGSPVARPRASSDPRLRVRGSSDP
jgi:RNA polymerase sigma-70 factor (ECF subfamily)